MGKEKNEKIYRANSFYHIYNRGNRKNVIFHREKDYQIFRGLMYKYIKKSHILLVGYCFMPNHFHLILKCGKDWKEIPKFMHSFMTSYSLYFNRRYFKVGRLFQGPFQVRRLLGLRDLNTVISYIKRNPEGLRVERNDEKELYKWLYIKEIKGK